MQVQEQQVRRKNEGCVRQVRRLGECKPEIRDFPSRFLGSREKNVNRPQNGFSVVESCVQKT